MSKLSKTINSKELQSIIEVLRLFKKVDKECRSFKKSTGISCVDKCGTCCMSSEVRTTVLEMMPLALKLWKEKEAEFWLSKINQIESPQVCVFYQVLDKTKGLGFCSQYRLRPLICRLFGFFTTTDKKGNYVYGCCRIIKQNYPQQYQKALDLMSQGFHPSKMTDFTVGVISSQSGINNRMVPINMACKLALEKIGLYLDINKTI